jgi:hypothetical protein
VSTRSAKSKATGLVTVDRRGKTIIMTTTNLTKSRAVTVFMTSVDAKRLARTLVSYAGTPS